MNSKDFTARQKFQNRITKGMLGPGSDTWGLPDKEEIISDYPLIRYFTGVLFPEKAPVISQFEDDIAEVENIVNEEDELQELNIEKENVEDNLNSNVSGTEDKEDIVVKSNSFFPTNIGLTVCINESVNQIDVDFSFGIYYQPSYKEKKIRISETGYYALVNADTQKKLSFANKLQYDGEYMYLVEALEGNAGGRKHTRSGDYSAFDEFRSKENIADSSARYYINYLDKLISRAWKRKDIVIRKKVKVDSNSEFIHLELPEGSHKELDISYNVKTYRFQGRKYVKVQLANTSEVHPRNRYSNKNERLNAKCIFQSQIVLTSNNILSFRERNENIIKDEETESLNLVYRQINSYGIGHNCAVQWGDENPTSISTTFIPSIDIKDVKNVFENDNDQKLDNALNIKNISSFGQPKEKVIENLRHFVSLYDEWISDQLINSEQFDEKDNVIASKIISKQRDNLQRLKEGVSLLEDENIFLAFQLANTAMYLQLIVSNDSDFGRYEKEVNELTGNINPNSLESFASYNAEKRKSEGKIRFIPKYRPFQLAFLLLSLDGIVNPESRSRKEIVDLIWFPTGGGKTEAYLAVAAFAIVWRRMNNIQGYEGTSVIMRYTLRLLTTQQFERASRLILALDFLRKQPEYSHLLKDEPISIGLWVGMASTPNSLKEAKRKVDEIETECEKTNGSPRDKNVFQISSCPWCGTKLISKVEDSWDYGFEYSKNDFTIKCLNRDCAFHKKIPVQVVDEILYNKPPTLLFGTVDKFAMLAWQSEAYKFFNTHSKIGMPPDLIIQDELHLLSGPLGSITGIFETVIELLSSKDGCSPKIIASTATTRNTSMQVEKLYGSREVNVFPPSGITQDDSFFAKADERRSNRRYMGFMPTGKTSIDTQLQILAHLFVSRLEVLDDPECKESIDNYWTHVAYYNSLRDVGRMNNKVGDEVITFTGFLQHRLSSLFRNGVDGYRFNYMGINARTKELTSRIPSEKIKETLIEIEEEFNDNKFTFDESERKYLNGVVDLVLATNMISVGIDISRLNIMLINGMPKNIAEYIQASSRIGRNTNGLAITLFDPNRAREKSYFENFIGFHQSFYKSIEPLSVTPFTENTIRKMVSSLMISFIRQYYPGELNRDDQAQYFTKDKLSPLIDFIATRFKDQPLELLFIKNELNRLSDEWITAIEQAKLKKYTELLLKPAEKNDDNEDWVIMQSMREIDTNSYITIKGYH